MDLTPKQIVHELNKYIIGQNEAKKAVAIALRNRYRRSCLSPELQDEITPKNIIVCLDTPTKSASSCCVILFVARYI